MTTMYAARTALRITQEELASVTNISQAMLSEYESGRRIPPPHTAQRIFRALGQTVTFPKEELNMTTPEIPKAVWTNDGRPDFRHLENEDTELTKAVEEKSKKKLTTANERAKNGAKVPEPPCTRWDGKGRPDFSNLDK